MLNHLLEVFMALLAQQLLWARRSLREVRGGIRRVQAAVWSNTVPMEQLFHAHERLEAFELRRRQLIRYILFLMTLEARGRDCLADYEASESEPNN